MYFSIQVTKLLKCPKTQVEKSAWILTLLVMKCVSTPWTVTLIQKFHVTTMSCHLWLYCLWSHCFLIISCQEGQCTALPFYFVLFSEHLQCPVCTYFLTVHLFKHNFMENLTQNLLKMHRKWYDGELSLPSNLLFNCMHLIQRLNLTCRQYQINNKCLSII